MIDFFQSTQFYQLFTVLNDIRNILDGNSTESHSVSNYFN